MGRCAGPCTGQVPVEDYARTVAEAAAVLAGDSRAGLEVLRERMRRLSTQARYEEAATVRDRMGALVRAASRTQRTAPLVAMPELVAARRTARGGWDLVCVRHGRLAGSTSAPRGADPMPYVAALRASAEVVAPPTGPGTTSAMRSTPRRSSAAHRGCSGRSAAAGRWC